MVSIKGVFSFLCSQSLLWRNGRCFAVIEEDVLEISEQFGDVLESGAVKAPASQLLLVCCWRTMKEVALLLGELAENAPLQIGDINPGLLTTKQVIKTHFHVSIELNFFFTRQKWRFYSRYSSLVKKRLILLAQSESPLMWTSVNDTWNNVCERKSEIIMWSDIWNVSYIELRIWNQVSYDHRSFWTQFKQLRTEAWKSQDFNGVWTRDLAIPVRHSNQLSYEATDVGSWSTPNVSGFIAQLVRAS